MKLVLVTYCLGCIPQNLYNNDDDDNNTKLVLKYGVMELLGNWLWIVNCYILELNDKILVSALGYILLPSSQEKNLNNWIEE